MYQLRKTISRSALSCALAAGLGGLAAGGGCNKDAATGAGNPPAKAGAEAFGVVDLDQVSKSVGWLDEINTNLTTTQSEIHRQLQVYADSVVSAFERKKEAIGAAANLRGQQLEDLKNPKENDAWQKLNLSRDQRDDLYSSANQVNQTLQALQNTQNQLMQSRKDQLLRSFAELARPVVRRVAAANGITIVATPPALFYYDASVDLTNKVVDELQKNMPQHTLPEMPKLNLPPFQFQKPTTNPVAATTQPK